MQDLHVNYAGMISVLTKEPLTFSWEFFRWTHGELIKTRVSTIKSLRIALSKGLSNLKTVNVVRVIQLFFAAVI